MFLERQIIWAPCLRMAKCCLGKHDWFEALLHVSMPWHALTQSSPLMACAPESLGMCWTGTAHGPKVIRHISSGGPAFGDCVPMCGPAWCATYKRGPAPRLNIPWQAGIEMMSERYV